jgi:hypothetical protein
MSAPENHLNSEISVLEVQKLGFGSTFSESCDLHPASQRNNSDVAETEFLSSQLPTFGTEGRFSIEFSLMKLKNSVS